MGKLTPLNERLTGKGRALGEMGDVVLGPAPGDERSSIRWKVVVVEEAAVVVEEAPSLLRAGVVLANLDGLRWGE